MNKIGLTHDKVALVSDEDYARFSRHKWRAWLQKRTGDWYAVRTERLPVDGVIKVRSVWMHREVLGLTFGDGLHGDHHDHDTLNNQRYNLRVATHSQNQGNSRKHKALSSKYKGVSWNKQRGMYAANIQVDRKRKFLGYRETEREAAMLYNEAALGIFGDFAALNQVEEEA